MHPYSNLPTLIESDILQVEIFLNRLSFIHDRSQQDKFVILLWSPWNFFSYGEWLECSGMMVGRGVGTLTLIPSRKVASTTPPPQKGREQILLTTSLPNTWITVEQVISQLKTIADLFTCTRSTGENIIHKQSKFVFAKTSSTSMSFAGCWVAVVLVENPASYCLYLYKVSLSALWISRNHLAVVKMSRTRQYMFCFVLSIPSFAQLPHDCMHKIN